MLLVRTLIRPSTIHGYGVFADEFIPKSTVIWRRHPMLDLSVSREQFGFLPKSAQDYIRHFAYLNENEEYVLCFDNAKYFNHAELPNTHPIAVNGDPEGIDVASRDIPIGEELTTDYRKFDEESAQKLRESTKFNDRGREFTGMELGA